MKRRIVAIALGLVAALGVVGGVAGSTMATGNSDASTVVALGSSWS